MAGARKLLVIADDSPEWGTALLYAAFRARNTGAGVVILRTLEPARFEHWAGVRAEMRRQATAEAEALIGMWAERAHKATGVTSEHVVREGSLKTELQVVMRDDPSIKILVLASSTGGRGPGPLVSAIAKGKLFSTLKLPVLVIPGDLDLTEVEALA